VQDGCAAAAFIKAALHFCQPLTSEEPQEDASRACVVGVLVASVSLAAGLMPLVGEGVDSCDSITLGWLDDAVAWLVRAVMHWEGAREYVKAHVLQPGVLLTWLQSFGASETGALLGVLQLASCMLAPLSTGGGGDAAEASGGSGGWGPAASMQVGDAAAATQGGACSQPAADKKVLAHQVKPPSVLLCLGSMGGIHVV
jgi:hypothetical protein